MTTPERPGTSRHEPEGAQAAPRLGPEALLRQAVTALATRLPEGLTLAVVPNPRNGKSEVVVTDGERRMATTLTDLRRRFTQQSVQADIDAVTIALREWVDARAVSDTEASQSGIATIAWHKQPQQRSTQGHPETVLKWQVVVQRAHATQVQPWVATTVTTRLHVGAVRSASHRHASALPVKPIQAGDVLVWTYPANPALSSSALANPAHVAEASAARLGVAVESLWAVCAPGRPIAVAGKAAALRLSEETMAKHVCAPLATFARVGW